MTLFVQVLNDLLDPSTANLKLREDPRRGFFVEGIKEETLVSAEHALSVIAMGVAHRKVISPGQSKLCCLVQRANAGAELLTPFVSLSRDRAAIQISSCCTSVRR